MNRTNCEKCLFADFSDSLSPCAMGIIDIIKESKNITKNNNNFNIIDNYRCAYGFNMDVYQDKQTEIGNINDLKGKLKERTKIKYYLIVFLDPSKLYEICESLLSLGVFPQFVSFILYQNNETEQIISTLKDKLANKITWKIHNMLEILDYQQSLDVVLDTNPYTKSSSYLWINTSENLSSWATDISNINHEITIKQPNCNALFRKPMDSDGLFLDFKNYDEIRRAINKNIIEALASIDNPIIKYYA